MTRRYRSSYIEMCAYQFAGSHERTSGPFFEVVFFSFILPPRPPALARNSTPTWQQILIRLIIQGTFKSVVSGETQSHERLDRFLLIALPVWQFSGFRLVKVYRDGLKKKTIAPGPRYIYLPFPGALLPYHCADACVTSWRFGKVGHPFLYFEFNRLLQAKRTQRHKNHRNGNLRT